MGNPDLHEITLENIQNYLIFKRKVSVYTAQKHLAYLRSSFNFALKNKYILCNHFSEIPNYRIPEKKPKFIKSEEYKILLDSIDEKWFRDIIEIAYYTGMRQMEILNLTWDDIDFDSEQIVISNRVVLSKSKRIRILPMSNAVKKILLSIYRCQTNLLVFQYERRAIKPDHISKKFKKQVKRLNINPSINFHSLRHTFASRLVQKGVSIYHVSKLLGHASVTTTQIYAHLRTDDLRASVELLE